MMKNLMCCVVMQNPDTKKLYDDVSQKKSLVAKLHMLAIMQKIEEKQAI